jgi:hypothetical protein
VKSARDQPSHQALYEYFQRTGDLERAERHRLQLGSKPTEQAPKQSLATENAEKKD